MFAGPLCFCPFMDLVSLFSTPFFRGPLGDAELLARLDTACRQLAHDDAAGRRWSRAHGYRGYTSYASLDDLPQRDPDFADLKRLLDRAVREFADAVHFNLTRAPKLDSFWVNILKPGGAHSGHIHPHSIISGTFYVAVPPGSGALRLEDPRLGLMMNAPLRRADAPAAAQPFFHAEPAAGEVFLWESWLRHEVLASSAKAERISISFNYR